MSKIIDVRRMTKYKKKHAVRRRKLAVRRRRDIKNIHQETRDILR